MLVEGIYIYNTYIERVSDIFTEETTFMTSSCSKNNIVRPKWCLLLNERICSGSKFFPLRVDLHIGGKENRKR